eukprot:1726590-Amphidinium_carterae.1
MSRSLSLLALSPTGGCAEVNSRKVLGAVLEQAGVSAEKFAETCVWTSAHEGMRKKPTSLKRFLRK